MRMTEAEEKVDEVSSTLGRDSAPTDMLGSAARQQDAAEDDALAAKVACSIV